MEYKKHIFFVDDDLDLATLTISILETKGFEVSYHNTLQGLVEGIEIYKPDLLILDIEVGNRSCLDELPLLRSKYPLIPIIFVSSHTDIEIIDRSYDNGINLFIKKPYGRSELIHNISLLLNSSRVTGNSHFTFGKFTFNTKSNQLYIGKQSIATLSPKESLLLQILLSHQEKAVSRSQLMQQIWGDVFVNDSLNNCINHLRHFLQEDRQVQILTQRGQGYLLTIIR